MGYVVHFFRQILEEIILVWYCFVWWDTRFYFQSPLPTTINYVDYFKHHKPDFFFNLLKYQTRMQKGRCRQKII